MKTSELCATLAQVIADVKENRVDAPKAQAILGLANAMTRARRLQLDYNRRKTAGSPAVDGLE